MVKKVSKIVKGTNGTACPYLLPENLDLRNDSWLLSPRRVSIEYDILFKLKMLCLYKTYVQS